VLIPVNTLVNEYGVRPDGVLHLGAHRAEELNAYANYNWGHVWWVVSAKNSTQSTSRTCRR